MAYYCKEDAKSIQMRLKSGWDGEYSIVQVILKSHIIGYSSTAGCVTIYLNGCKEISISGDYMKEGANQQLIRDLKAMLKNLLSAPPEPSEVLLEFPEPASS